MSKKILAFAAVVAIASFLIFNMEAKDETLLKFNEFKAENGKFYMTAEV
jgi:hypothetical protein